MEEGVGAGRDRDGEREGKREREISSHIPDYETDRACCRGRNSSEKRLCKEPKKDILAVAQIDPSVCNASSVVRTHGCSL